MVTHDGEDWAGQSVQKCSGLDELVSARSLNQVARDDDQIGVVVPDVRSSDPASSSSCAPKWMSDKWTMTGTAVG